MVWVYSPTLSPWLAWTSYGVDGSSCGLLLGPRVQQNLWRAPLIGCLTPPLLWCLLELAHMSQIGLGASRVYDKYSEKQQGPVGLGYMINTLVILHKTTAGRSNCMLEVALKKNKEKKGKKRKKGRVQYELCVIYKQNNAPVPCHCFFLVFFICLQIQVDQSFVELLSCDLYL